MDEQLSIRLSLCDITHTFLNTIGKNYTLNTTMDFIAVLVGTEDDSFPNGLRPCLTRINKEIQKQFGFSVSVGIGLLVCNKSDIHGSYLAALEYVDYRFIYGQGSIIGQENTKGIVGDNIEYPIEIEIKLIEVLKLNNTTGISTSLDCFFRQLRKVPYKQALFFTNQLLMAVYKEFFHLITSKNLDSSIVHNLYDIEFIAEIEEKVTAFCTDINESLLQLKDNKNKAVIDFITNFVAENYGDPNLSVEYIAEKVHFSPNYIRRLFKELKNASFGDYLNQLRLEHACDLLCTTCESSRKISKRVGLHHTYFFTLFKKEYGMTPTQYRNENGCSN